VLFAPSLTIGDSLNAPLDNAIHLLTCNVRQLAGYQARYLKTA
jgi:hypothetical protein